MAVADVTSANVVGYLNRDGRTKCNFYTPCFDKVGGSAVTIQDVQLTDDVEDMGADLQILDMSRKCIGEAYQWLTPAMAGKDGFDLGLPEGMGAWVNEDYALPEIDPLEFGQVVQVTLPSGAGFKSSGEVSDDDAAVTGRAKCNFVGNPYPVEMSIENIQCDDSVEDMGADLQILDASRKCIGEAYQWLTPAMAGKDGFDLGLPEGMGAWVNEDYALPEIDPLKPGEGTQVTLPSVGTITVICPIEL